MLKVNECSHSVRDSNEFAKSNSINDRLIVYSIRKNEFKYQPVEIFKTSNRFKLIQCDKCKLYV